MSIGGKPAPGAFVTERPGDRGDHADLAAAVGIMPAFRDLAGVVGINRLQRVACGDALQHLPSRHHLVHAPAVAATHVHVFDETQHDAAVAEMPGHRDELVIVRPATHHHVDLDRRKPDALRLRDAVQYRLHRRIGVAHALEGRFAQAVQADGNARQPGVLQRLRLPGQQHAVGGQRDLDRRPVCRLQPRETLDQLLDAASQQRLAAGQAYLPHAEPDKLPRQPLDLLEGEQFGARQERMVLVEHRARHAIGAAQIAAVGDRDAQIAQRPRHGVDDGRIDDGEHTRFRHGRRRGYQKLSGQG